ncbi:MAG: competence/damage-inducible protein A [Deltaproteobacteria bacterium]|nr:competence/damage-inducible protein A [Deltaproteobacteria bacterium]
MSRTAAALIIGNEVLTGKVQERNLAALAKVLFGVGMTLRRVVICPDEEEGIADDLNALRASHDVVFTSGGIGPTHDDVTIAAVARAFGRPQVRSPQLEDLLRNHFGGRLTERHLRMADLPEGFRLLGDEPGRWPAVIVDNVYVLPGLPEVFLMKLPLIRRSLETGSTFVSRAVYTHCDEGEIADLLEHLAVDHPRVGIGSYPVWEGRGYSLKLTFDGREQSEVDAAAEALLAALPAESLANPTLCEDS